MRRLTTFVALALVATLFAVDVLDTDARGRRRGRRSSNEGVSVTSRMTADRPWYFYWTTGQEAERSGNYKRAKDNYLLSINADPEPDMKKRVTGRKFEVYLPYLAAARAYYYLGDTAKAEEYLKVSERKGVAPPDEIGALFQLIVEGRQTPRLYIYSMADQERTRAAFVDIKGIAFDYHNIDRVVIYQGNNEVEATVRDAVVPDEVKELPYEPRISNDLRRDIKYFEYLSFPLENYGQNRIYLRAHATNPDRMSDLVEVSIFRDKPEEEKPAPTPVPTPMQDEAIVEGEEVATEG